MTRWEIAAHVHALVGEGPEWDERDDVLWFVDVTAGALHRLDPSSGSLDTRQFGTSIGAAIPCTTGGLLLALEDGLHTFTWGDAGTVRIVAVEADDPSVRMNDAKCDPRGRLWAGTMAYDYAQGRSTLYRFDTSGPTPVAAGCTIANGTGWSPDGATMYFIDTPTRRIDTFDYDVGSGSATSRRPWVTVEEGAGMPDGMTVDSEGCVWVSLWGGSAVRRYSRDGMLLDVVNLPVTQVASACFGGPSLTDLYITTAAHLLGPAGLADQPLAGATFVVATDVVGSPTQQVDLSTLGVGR